MKVTLHESDKVSEESDGPIPNEGTSFEEVDGTDESSPCHLLVSLARGESLLEGVDEPSLSLVGGAGLVYTLCDILEHILCVKQQQKRLLLDHQ